MTNEGLDAIEYRDIPGFPGYQVGNDGSVWSFWVHRKRQIGPTRRQLKPWPNEDGYLRVELSLGNGKTKSIGVHVLVLLGFVGSRPSGKVACHFPDRCPSNNNLNNLRWGTYQDNCEDALKHGTRAMGASHPRAKLTEDDVREIRRLRSTMSLAQLGKRFGVRATHIVSIASGEYWRFVK